MSSELIRQLEELAVRAWPAVEVRELDGWLLRRSAASTRRANSVWPNGPDTLPLGPKLAQVEAFYAAAGVPARYQICPAARPPDLDTVLADRGYGLECPTLVQTASLATVAERAGGAAEEAAVAAAPDEEWLDAYRLAAGFSAAEVAARHEIMRRIAVGTGYALLRRGGRAVAVGMGAVDNGWLGAFNMATSPEWRRRGAATAVLHALARWGLGQGATHAYLQVTEENVPALALYGRLGFATLYGYHYRTRSV
jgi:GNAT superfamily N-acetyltransferase